MLRRGRQSALPHRLMVYYLFFGLAAMSCLAVGVVLATLCVSRNQSENVVLARLGKVSASIEMDYVRHGAENLQRLVSQLRADGKLTYGSVVGIDGKYVAHTSPDLVGKTAISPTGTRSRFGDVEGIRFVDEDSRVVHEYHFPLHANRVPIGVFRAGTLEPSMKDTLLRSAEYAPLAFLLPTVLICVGAFVISRKALPLAEVDNELRQVARLPLGQPVNLRRLKVNTGAALGWNRLVESFQKAFDPTSDNPASNSNQKVKPAVADPANDILALLPDGVALTDENGIVVKANPALSAILGNNTEELKLTGSRIEDYFPEEESATAIPLFACETRRERCVSADLAFGNQSITRTLRFSRHPWRSEQGQLQGFLWTVRDITQQKLAENMRDQFINAATHELRTPLANIKAYAETLAATDDLDVESQKEFCNTMNSEATRLARFVDDLLSVSSMEAGAISIEMQNVEVSRLLAEVVDKVEPLMKSKAIVFKTEIPAKLPELKLDKDKIVATLVNLLGNAAKYTPHGGHVALRVTNKDNKLQLHVDDTGIGISAEEVPRVFDKFFRSDDERVREQTGTGLGLALAQELVQLHDGTLTVTSEINKGSTFTVTLPMIAG